MNINLDSLLIAHRGESYLAPENTLSAIKLAWEYGATAVEIDIQLTRDNEIVVIHDKNTKRVGNLNMNIKKSLLKELKTIDVGAFKNSKWQGEKIPTLSEVLETIPPKGKLIIEIKCGVKILEPLRNLLQNASVYNYQIEIISFNRKVLTEFKKLMPQYTMLLLLDLDYYWPACLLISNTTRTINRVLKGKLDGVNVWAGKKINKSYVQAFKKHNLLVYTWTVNDFETVPYLIEFGVDGITSDRPSWLKSKLANEISL